MAPTPTGLQLRSVSGVAGDVWIASEQDLFHWDGAQFERYDVGAALYDYDYGDGSGLEPPPIVRAKANEIWLNPNTMFDGEHLHHYTHAEPPLALNPTPFGDGTAVTETEYFDGARWLPLPQPRPYRTPELVWGDSPSKFNAVYTDGQILAYDEGSITTLVSSSPTYEGVLALPSGELLAWTEQDTGTVDMWGFNGEAWSTLGSYPGGFSKIAAASSAEVVAFANESAYSIVGGQTTLLPLTARVEYATALPTGEVMATTTASEFLEIDDGAVRHLNEGPVGRVNVVWWPLIGTEFERNLRTTSIFSVDDALFVTHDGPASLLRLQDGGRQEFPMESPDWTLQGVWAASPNDAWVIGLVYDHENDTTFERLYVPAIFHFDGVSVTRVALDDDFILGGPMGIRGTGPNDIWAWGTQVNFHYDGVSWTRTTSDRLNFMGASANDVWACSSYAAEHFDGQTWTSYDLPSPPSMIVLDGATTWMLGDDLYKSVDGGQFQEVDFYTNYIAAAGDKKYFWMSPEDIWVFTDDIGTGKRISTPIVDYYFKEPSGLTSDAAGNLYVRVENGIREHSPAH
ncbi:MAG: hypothetical protein U0271_26915 [Polyangiaceae bacterium]